MEIVIRVRNKLHLKILRFFIKYILFQDSSWIKETIKNGFSIDYLFFKYVNFFYIDITFMSEFQYNSIKLQNLTHKASILNAMEEVYNSYIEDKHLTNTKSCSLCKRATITEEEYNRTYTGPNYLISCTKCPMNVWGDVYGFGCFDRKIRPGDSRFLSKKRKELILEFYKKAIELVKNTKLGEIPYRFDINEKSKFSNKLREIDLEVSLNDKYYGHNN